MEEVLIQRAVTTTAQIVYDKSLFDCHDNADEVLKDFLFVGRRITDLGELKDFEIQ